MKVRLAMAWLGMSCAASLASGCGDDASDGPVCLDSLPESCTPRFTPTWANIHEYIVAPSCGGAASGPSCHGPDRPAGRIELSSKDGSYRALLGLNGAPARVIPEDALCSPLMERIATPDPNRRMPYKTMELSDEEKCAVQQWIDRGAKP